jgi:hypothetical protein
MNAMAYCFLNAMESEASALLAVSAGAIRNCLTVSSSNTSTGCFGIWFI